MGSFLPITLVAPVLASRHDLTTRNESERPQEISP